MGRDGSLNVSGERKEINGKRERQMTCSRWFLSFRSFLSVSISLQNHSPLFLHSEPIISFVASPLFCYPLRHTHPPQLLYFLMFFSYLQSLFSPSLDLFIPYYFLSSLVQRSAVMCGATKCQNQNHFTSRTCILSMWRIVQILYMHM